VTPRLLVGKAARQDIAEAFRWYEDRSVGLGYEFTRSVRVTFAAIQRAPLQYPLAVKDIRKTSIGRFPYIVYYVVLEETISVIAMMHGRRNPRTWKSRR
jgi:toxin ParE1/3/4